MKTILSNVVDAWDIYYHENSFTNTKTKVQKQNATEATVNLILITNILNSRQVDSTFCSSGQNQNCEELRVKLRSRLKNHFNKT